MVAGLEITFPGKSIKALNRIAAFLTLNRLKRNNKQRKRYRKISHCVLQGRK